MSILFLLIVVLVSCGKNSDNTKKIEEIPKKKPITKIVKPIETVHLDSFFYTSIELQKIGEQYNYEMLRHTNNSLLVTGIFYEEFPFEIGDSSSHFFKEYFKGYDINKFASIDTVEFSSDIRGDDTRFLIIKDGLLVGIIN